MTLISYSDAVAAIASACVPRAEQWVSPGQALGCVPARAAVGALASPPFNNAAMDGFAVRAEDSAGAAPESPVELPVRGILKAGAFAEAAPPGSGSAMRVATGALTPPPLDTVIPRERARVVERQDGERLLLAAPVEKGRNLRLAGEEYPAGAAFDYAGTRLNAGHVALLTAAGVSGLAARRPPPLGLFTTGDEVRPPGAALAPGEIVNANGAWLAAWCAERCIPVAASRHVADDAKKLAQAFGEARESGAAALVCSGSASAGERDVLRRALARVDARIVFHGVAMRPGKPALFALLKDGAPFFGLPGNPLATAAGMRFLAWPGIRGMMGMEGERPRRARLAEGVRLREGYTHFLLARRARRTGAAGLVQPQRPGQAGALAAADCWLRLEGGVAAAGVLANRYSL